MKKTPDITKTRSVIPPQQKRSQEKLDRIISASYQVASEVGFESATLAQIAEKASISVGTLYTRFKNKEALLNVIHEVSSEKKREYLSRLSEENHSGHSIREVLTTVISGSIESARKTAGFQRACYQRALTDPVFAAREASLRQESLERVTAILLARKQEIRHPNPKLAVKFCVELYISFITDHVIASNLNSSELSDYTVTAELIDTCAQYLRLE